MQNKLIFISALIAYENSIGLDDNQLTTAELLSVIGIIIKNIDKSFYIVKGVILIYLEIIMSITSTLTNLNILIFWIALAFTNMSCTQ